MECIRLQQWQQTPITFTATYVAETPAGTETYKSCFQIEPNNQDYQVMEIAAFLIRSRGRCRSLYDRPGSRLKALPGVWNLILRQNMTAVVSSIWKAWTERRYFNGGDVIVFEFTNTNSRTWGIEIIYRRQVVMTTKTPAIPSPRDPVKCLTAIKELLEVREGIRGEKDSENQFLDRFITYRELIDIILNNEAIGMALSVALTAIVGFGTPSEITISGGAITVPGNSFFRYHTVDTEGDAASDDLTLINGGNAGELLMIQAAHEDSNSSHKE